MKTPICDFVSRYIQKNPTRMHMPGHKGVPLIGCESRDITEIRGADMLYAADGIIRESEENAAALFGAARTLYSTEGSSLCIRAMVHLVRMLAHSRGERPLIAAARNAHTAFVHAAAVLDVDVTWLPSAYTHILSYTLDMAQLETLLRTEHPVAVYITTPDYLGNRVDMAPIGALCHRYGSLLLVDNAHGAYLKWLPNSLHPLDAGADMCCDSAHKTLPTLTGGAYLHIAHNAPNVVCTWAEQALSVYASTSPSYLILQSLDTTNAVLAGDFAQKLSDVCARVAQTKAKLMDYGYALAGDEPTKITINAKSVGYTGTALAEMLEQCGIICEFYDPDYVVLMVSAATSERDVERVEQILCAVPRLPSIPDVPPRLPKPVLAIRPHDALFAPHITIPVTRAEGEIAASAGVVCPPAVPIVMCGERITTETVACFAYYGIEECTVVDTRNGSKSRFD